MKRKNAGPLIFLVIIIIGLIFVVIEIGLLYSLQRGSSPLALLGQPPTIRIMHPQGDRIINSGEGLMLAAVGISDSGLQRVDFLVDGSGEQQLIVDPFGAKTSDSFFPWFGSTTGVHQLSVVAYDVQGRASAPASVQIGVQAVDYIGELADQAAEAGAHVDDQQPQEEAPQGPDAEPQDGAAPQEPVQPAEQPADQAQPQAPAGEQAGEPDADLALPPQPQDQPPEITRFDVFVDVFGGENGVPIAVSAAAVGSSQDDLGLDRLTITWRNDARQSGDFTAICAAAQNCEIEMEAGLDMGRWVFSLQAFDTSGQASEPEIKIVEVIGGNGQPPGAVEHDFDEDWLRDHLRNQAERFEFEDDIVDFWRRQGMGMDDFLEEMFPGARDADPAPEDIQEVGFCLNISVQPAHDGNLVTLEISCEIQVEGEGRFVIPYVTKRIVNTGDDGISLFIPEWRDENRVALQAGERFTWLDRDTTCGTTYRYGGRVDSARMSDLGLATGDNFAIAGAEATTPACAPESIADINLRADAIPEGTLIHWDVSSDGNWPDDLPAEGVTFWATRFDELTGQVSELDSFTFPPDALMRGGHFTVFDDEVECGISYWYSVAALPADRDLSLVAPGWLLRSTIPGPDISCDFSPLHSLELDVTPFWVQNAFQHIRLQVDLPAGFDWPVDDNVELKIVRIRPGAERCEGPPCLGIWQVKESVRITDDIRSNGLFVEDIDSSIQIGSHTYVYRMALLVNGEEVQSSPRVQVRTAPMPPPPPDILRLTASNDCPGAVQRCVLVEWDLYEQPRPSPNIYQAARIAVERIVQGFDQREFPVNLADTQFMDLDLYVMELELANGQVRRICHYDVTYRMIAYSEEGYKYGASPLTLDMPAECDDPLNIVVERRR